jgi:hypothetical protein
MKYVQGGWVDFDAEITELLKKPRVVREFGR